MKDTRSISVTERLAALSEAVRLRVLRLLEAEELAVGEVAKVMQLPQSTVSRHLKVLADAGWIAKRNEGTATLYRVWLDDLPPDARRLWLAVRDQIEQSAELTEDARRLAGVLAERRLDSQAFFGRVAGEWDDLRSQLFGTTFTPQALLTLLPRNWVVADVGCGTGNASELLAPVVERVIAIDRSEAMLSAARRRLGGVSNVEFLSGDADRLPIADESVDAAVCVLLLHHLDDPVASLREMARALRVSRGGGVVLVVDMAEHDREQYRHSMGHRHLGFSEGAVSRLMGSAGLKLRSYRELPVAGEAKGPGLFAAVGGR